jgi:hypothetical protein
LDDERADDEEDDEDCDAAVANVRLLIVRSSRPLNLKLLEMNESNDVERCCGENDVRFVIDVVDDVLVEKNAAFVRTHRCP